MKLDPQTPEDLREDAENAIEMPKGMKTDEEKKK